MFSKIKRDYKILLAHRRLPFILPFLSVLLVLGALGTGLQLDDFIIQSTVQNSGLVLTSAIAPKLPSLNDFLVVRDNPYFQVENRRGPYALLQRIALLPLFRRAS